MGLFDAFKGWNTPDATGVTKWDRVAMVGASMQDNPQAMAAQGSVLQQKQQAGELARKRALQEQQMQALTGLATPFAGGQKQSTMPIAPIGDFTGTSPQVVAQAQSQNAMAAPPTLRGMAPQLAQAAAAGVDIAPWVSLLDKSGPSIKYERGMRYDERDPSSAPGFVPEMDKGQEPVFDARGNIVGVRNMDGAIQAAAQMAGAVTGAQEGAKAGYDLVPVPLGDGRTQMMPRSQAVQLLGGGGVGGGMGVAQSPAEQAAAVDLAKGGAERQLAQPQQWAGLQDQARATDLAIQTINEILGQSLGPNGQFVQSGDSMISPMTTGFGANLSGIKGTPAYNLQSKITPLLGIIGFGELQKMRANSPTGGALGNVSEKENTTLQSLYGALQTGQGGKQFAEELMKARNQLLEVKRHREALFNQQYGGGQQQKPKPSARPSRSAVEAELRRRGLIK